MLVYTRSLFEYIITNKIPTWFWANGRKKRLFYSREIFGVPTNNGESDRRSQSAASDWLLSPLPVIYLLAAKALPRSAGRSARMHIPPPTNRSLPLRAYNPAAQPARYRL